MNGRKKKNVRNSARLHKGSTIKMLKHQNVEGPIWDTVQAVMVDCRAFFSIPATIAPLIRNEILNRLVDLPAVNRLMTTLDQDVSKFRESLETINAKHQGRTGAATDPNDHMRALQVSEEYVKWASTYESVILPTIEQIASLYADAETKLKAQEATPSGVEQVLEDEVSNGDTVSGNAVPVVNEDLTVTEQKDPGTNE